MIGEGRFTFLICSERSGSNLLTGLLNGHPEISAPPPSHLFRLFASNAGNYGVLEHDANWSVLLDDVTDAFAAQLGSWNTALDADALRALDLPRRPLAPLVALYLNEAAHDGASRVFVKENHTARFAEQLIRDLPGSRFVFMVRDPRDVAASYLATDSIEGGVERAAAVWHDDQDTSERLRQHPSMAERIHFLRYEELLRDTAGALRDITGFLELEYDPAMLEFYRDARLRRNAERIGAWRNLARPVLTGNAGKYRDLLRPEEIEYVELCCGGLMRGFGYLPEIVGEPPGAAAARRAERLRPGLRPGQHTVETATEAEIRARRRAVIERVLSRRLAGSSPDAPGV